MGDVDVGVVKYEMKCEGEKEVMEKVRDFVIGKGDGYEDRDLGKEGVGVVGEMEVVKGRIELGVGVWDEERMVVVWMIEEEGK